ncbi:MAG: hypothetical protein ABIR68_19160 [Ilumatobacteraceae bacterium]
MNAVQLRRAAPMIYGIIAAILWIFVKGTVALAFSIVGAMLLGLMYALSGEKVERDGLGRQRNRNRDRP